MRTALQPYVPIADALAQLFAPQVEVVLHDAVSGRIAYMAQAFSKRHVGDESLIEGDQDLPADSPVSPTYEKTNWNGHRLRCVSVALRDRRGKLEGYLCINHDVQALVGLQAALNLLLPAAPVPHAVEPAPAAMATLFAQDWREQINTWVGQFLREHRRTLDGLTLTDVLALLGALDARGAFAIRSAPRYVAEVLGVSRATLYSRLKQARQSNKPAVPGP